MALVLGTAFIRVQPMANGFGSVLGTQLSGASSALAGFGRSMSAAFTLPVVAAFSAGAKEAVAFESAFTGVRKTVDATEPEFARIKSGIVDMANVMPATREEIAGVVAAAGQFGVANENLMTFTETAIKLGVSTNLSAQDAAFSLTQLANITKLPQDQFNNLGSAVVALGNNFPTTEKDIANFAKRLAGAGSVAGISSQSLVGFAGGLSALGIKAEAGGTAFSRVFISMNSAVSDGGEALDKFAKVAGITSKDFAAQWKADPTSAVLGFVKGLKDLNETGANVPAILKDMGLGEIRVRDALLRGAAGFDTLSGAVNLSNQAFIDNTALNEEAAKRFGTTESQMAIFKNQISNVARVFGEALLPVINDVLASLTPMIARVLEGVTAFGDLDPHLQKVAVGFAAALAAIGPLALAASGLIRIIKGVGGAFSALGAVVANPIILVIAAAIAAAGYVIYRNWDTLVGWWNAALPTLKDTAQSVMDGIQVAIKWVAENVIPVLETAIRSTIDFAQKVWPKLVDIIGGVWKWISDNVFPVAVAIFNGIVDAGSIVVDWFGNHWDEILGAVKDVWDWLDTNMVPVAEAAFEAVGHVFEGLVDTGKKVWPVLVQGFNAIKAVVQEVASAFARHWEGIKQVLLVVAAMAAPVLAGMVLAFRYGFDAIKWAVDNILLPAATWIWKAIEDAAPLVGAAIDGIAAALGTAIDGIKWTIENVFKPAWDAIAAKATEIWDKVSPVLTDLWTAISDGFGLVKTMVETIWTPTWGLIKLAVDTIWSVMKPILSSIWTAIDFGFGIVKALVSTVWGPAWSLVSSTVQGVWDLVSIPLGLLFTAIDLGIKAVDWAMTNVFKPAFEVIQTVVEAVWDKVEPILKDLGDAFGTVASAASTAFEGVVGGMKAVWNALARAWNNTIGALSIPSVKVLGVGFDGFDVPNLSEIKHGGGVITGFGRREVPALLERGEVVFTKSQAKALGGMVNNPGSTAPTLNVEKIEVGKASDAREVTDKLEDLAWRIRVGA